MSRILFALATTAIMAGTAYASMFKSYQAYCNDGQNLQYNISSSGAGLLYAKTPTGILQIAAYRASVMNTQYSCAAPMGSSTTDTNVFNLCITTSTAAGGVTPQAIIVARVFANGGIQQQGVVCKANIKTSS